MNGGTVRVAGTSFVALVSILGSAPPFSSEYSGPPIPSRAASLDSPVLDSAALGLFLIIGVGCLPCFCWNTLAVFAGTA